MVNTVVRALTRKAVGKAMKSARSVGAKKGKKPGGETRKKQGARAKNNKQT